MSSASIDRAALTRIHERESRCYVEAHPRCREHHERAQRHWLNGVPMHWMTDWALPFPLTVKEAQGATLLDLDGHVLADFCLGDTGAMFGHSPAPIAEALKARAGEGLTFMLPTALTAHAGELLAERFGLPFWQMTQTATDANRAIIRWARAITGRHKILVFDGCYHGTVDDAFVRVEGDRVVPRCGQVGRVVDVVSHARVVEFNDLAALEASLAHRDVACVLAEPVMTNAGMVLPDANFWPQARELCTRFGTLLALDETHTLSSGPRGHAHTLGIGADLLTLGKAIAGGVPCGLFGFTAEVQTQMAIVLASKPSGHSGLGTTLAANALATTALVACLEHVMTPASFEHMDALADELAQGLRSVLHERGLPWHIARVGSRVELSFRSTPPRTARESLETADGAVERAIHMYLLNRGVLITPFHNMMLISPATTRAQVQQLLEAFTACIRELT